MRISSVLRAALAAAVLSLAPDVVCAADAASGPLPLPPGNTAYPPYREEAPPPAGLDARTHLLTGTVESYAGSSLQIRTANGVFPVKLRRGTQINPRGATPRVGMRVGVFGSYGNGIYDADRINLVY